jgi:DNA-binding winged helix-turn-helix (wHTH) protein
LAAIHHFGPFELRPQARLLVQDGQPLELGARAFDLLLALLECRDRLVTKSELLELVWPGVIVEENNLQVQVSTLRKILGRLERYLGSASTASAGTANVKP